MPKAGLDGPRSTQHTLGDEAISSNPILGLYTSTGCTEDLKDPVLWRLKFWVDAICCKEQCKNHEHITATLAKFRIEGQGQSVRVQHRNRSW